MSQSRPGEPDSAAGASALLRHGFHAEVTAADGAPVVRLYGELDIASAPRLTQSLTEAMTGESVTLALDLANLTFIDSAGIGAIVTAHRRANRSGSALVIQSPQPAVLKVFRITGVDQHLTIEEPDSGPRGKA